MTQGSVVTVSILLTGQGPDVVYSIVYVVPEVTFVTSPVTTSMVAPSVGIGFNAKVPSASPYTSETIFIVAPSQVDVAVKVASSSSGTVTVCASVIGQIPAVVYSTIYSVPGTPLVISPVTGSIAAPSVALKVNVPPVSPTIVAVAPVQVAVNVNDGSSFKSAEIINWKVL